MANSSHSQLICTQLWHSTRSLWLDDVMDLDVGNNGLLGIGSPRRKSDYALRVGVRIIIVPFRYVYTMRLVMYPSAVNCT